MARFTMLATVVAVVALLGATVGAASAPQQYPPPEDPYPTPSPSPPATTSAPSIAVTPKTRLVLTAGPAQVITLKTKAGKKVTKLKLGTYTMLVRDRSTFHNAHVIAPGYNRKTTLPFVGSQTWKVKLKKTGTLRFLCDPHAIVGMKGSAKIVR
jgi:hypothetical protein